MSTKPKHPGGRPTIYTPELGKKICDAVAATTLGLRKLCEINSEFPDESSVRLWRTIHPEFSLLYAQAKTTQADLLAEEMIEIADDSRNDWMENTSEQESLGYRMNGEHVNRSRLRIDTRKFLASKLLPKKYGDMRLVEELTADNVRVKAELEELRAKLNMQNRKEY